MDPDQPSASQISSGAGFWVRAGARLIDTIFGVILGLAAGVFGGIALVVAEKSGTISPGWEHRAGGLNLPGFGLSLLGGFLYYSITEGMFGASLGKLICQLRVVTEDGHAINFPKALLRNLAYYFDALFFGLVGYSSMKESPLNQRYGDKWAHTVVVRSKQVPADSRETAVIFVLAFLIGSTCWGVLNALGLVLHAM